MKTTEKTNPIAFTIGILLGFSISRKLGFIPNENLFLFAQITSSFCFLYILEQTYYPQVIE